MTGSLSPTSRCIHIVSQNLNPRHGELVKGMVRAYSWVNDADPRPSRWPEGALFWSNANFSRGGLAAEPWHLSHGKYPLTGAFLLTTSLKPGFRLLPAEASVISYIHRPVRYTAPGAVGAIAPIGYAPPYHPPGVLSRVICSLRIGHGQSPTRFHPHHQLPTSWIYDGSCAISTTS
jgi:hypothetical protein